MSGLKTTLILLAVVSVSASIAVIFSDNIYFCWHEEGRTVHVSTGHNSGNKFCPYRYTTNSLCL